MQRPFRSLRKFPDFPPPAEIEPFPLKFQQNSSLTSSKLYILYPCLCACRRSFPGMFWPADQVRLQVYIHVCLQRPLAMGTAQGGSKMACVCVHRENRKATLLLLALLLSADSHLLCMQKR